MNFISNDKSGLGIIYNSFIKNDDFILALIGLFNKIQDDDYYLLSKFIVNYQHVIIDMIKLLIILNGKKNSFVDCLCMVFNRYKEYYGLGSNCNNEQHEWKTKYIRNLTETLIELQKTSNEVIDMSLVEDQEIRVEEFFALCVEFKKCIDEINILMPKFENMISGIKNSFLQEKDSLLAKSPLFRFMYPLLLR